MRIAIGADHAGFVLKQRLIPMLRQLGHEVDDRRAPVRVMRGRDDPGRLVHRVDDPARRAPERGAVDRDRLGARDASGRVGDRLPVDGHAPLGDQHLRRAARRDARVGEVLGETHRREATV